MTETSPRIEDLLSAYRAGNTEAGNRLLQHYEPWLKLIARFQMESRFHAKFDSADVVQEAMLEAVRAFPQFRGHSAGEFAAWLRTILAHALAHEIRHYASAQKRDLGREVSLEAELDRTSQCLGNRLAGTGTSPSQQAIDHEQQLRLAKILDRLPEPFREVIILRHLENLPYEEVARRMNRSPGAVRMLWVRALARLRVQADLASLDGPKQRPVE